MFGVLAWLVGNGTLNDVAEHSSPLVTLGWGEWHGVDWVVLMGWTIKQGTCGALDYRLVDARLHYRCPNNKLHFAL